MYASKFSTTRTAYRFMRAGGKTAVQAWAWIKASPRTAAGEVIVYGIGPAMWDRVGRKPD